jgi:two-component system cell cycle response regulator
VPDASIVLASAALVCVLVRLRLTFRENLRMLRRSRLEAMTDPLTSLGNRRQLMVDLEEALADGSPRILVLFDLDGFKNYNDSFGHPAGDALLNRLGENLSEAVADNGVVYRIGGDEFCALIHAAASREGSLVEDANRALTEHGQGFIVGSSYGAVVLPLEASSSSEALQIADRRLYRQKSAGQRTPRMQTGDVLMRILEERQPRALIDMRQVVRMAVAIGHRLGLSYEELDELTRAAELADIGKMAVPDTILKKNGPLTPKEWAFVQRHTVIGEAILSAAPALGPVARLVRSSHERFDGTGYPDGLAGEAIPLGSRVLVACDAFDAMTKDRPHAPSRTRAEALAEIARCSGTQFDPRVVQALSDVVSDGDGGDDDDLAMLPVAAPPLRLA